MTLIDIISLFSILVALAALPSASVALVVTRSATLGLGNGIAVAVGIVLGDLLFVVLAVFGLSVVAETMGGLFTVIRYLGALYLFWLGATLFLAKSSVPLVAAADRGKRHLLASGLAGFLLTLGDIKAIFFYVSLFPVYIDLAALQGVDIVTLLAVTAVGIGGVKIIYACSAARFAAVTVSPRVQTIARKTTGGLMIGAGGYLLVNP